MNGRPQYTANSHKARARCTHTHTHATWYTQMDKRARFPLCWIRGIVSLSISLSLPLCPSFRAPNRGWGRIITTARGQPESQRERVFADPCVLRVPRELRVHHIRAFCSRLRIYVYLYIHVCIPERILSLARSLQLFSRCLFERAAYEPNFESPFNVDASARERESERGLRRALTVQSGLRERFFYFVRLFVLRFFL